MGPGYLPVERLSVEMEVRDAATDAFRADSARRVVHDGAFTDSLPFVLNSGEESIPSALGGVYERPGTSSIRIERSGYQPWDTTGVQVSRDRCGALPVRVVARLSPVS
jgi:hypothetical protein